MPGVVLLDCVLSEAERFLGQGLAARALSQVKFTSMLLPEEIAELELQLMDQFLRFAITRAGQPIAQGAFALGTTRDGRL